MQDLKRVLKGIYLACHFVAQVSNFCYVLENGVLLVLKVLVQTLNVSERILNLDVDLAHLL